MLQTSGTPPIPAQNFPVLDSYIDVDFAELFGASVALSDGELDLGGAADDNRDGMVLLNGDGIDICVAVDAAVVVDDDDDDDDDGGGGGEIDLRTETSFSLLLTSELSQLDLGSSSRSSDTWASLTVIDTAQEGKASHAIAAPDMNSIHRVRHDEMHHQINNKSRPTTTSPENAPVHTPTTRVELRTLYDRFPDMCPSVPAPAPTFSNRGSSTQNHSTYVRSAPTTPRKYGAPDSRRLAESFASRTPLPGNLPIAPRMLKESLRDWYQMPGFMARCRREQAADPYPHLDMKEGWNRARCQGEQWHGAFARAWRAPSRKMLDFMETREQLARFSWGEQADSIVVDGGGVAEGAFERIFRGGGCGDGEDGGAGDEEEAGGVVGREETLVL
ncbi:hypothetical protein DSL72_004824 [Monilinia vaccinii-corymbosi]|uniref:Uncharacterized protein n=1 Tax=Monilinia vaccinii-corymbosi TaxID=61207 RepID=A0A8A3P080_9HELO|nr:hypothetical protein DSL72_004824 [Monilinia vaccinii-corymbosi]